MSVNSCQSVFRRNKKVNVQGTFLMISAESTASAKTNSGAIHNECCGLVSILTIVFVIAISVGITRSCPCFGETEKRDEI